MTELFALGRKRGIRSLRRRTGEMPRRGRGVTLWIMNSSDSNQLHYKEKRPPGAYSFFS